MNHVGNYKAVISPADLTRRFATDRLASRIWARDPGPFQDRGAPAEAVRHRLGWLAAPADAAAALPALTAFGDAARAEGLTDLLLLGMGGSSLCAEVLRDVPSPRRHAGRLVVLDTTDERAILVAAGRLVPTRTLVLVASKSGTTVEVDALERWFWSRMQAALGPRAGRQFVAITDPGTPLTVLAAERGYRHTFVNPPDIGGRYSALSRFGLVPAALLGLDLQPLVESASAMADRCRVDAADNPGLALGAFMAANALAGRDKLTLALPHDLAPLGAWIEQLVAESTGKHGRGVLPVVDEPAGGPESYGADRMFVSAGDGPAAAEADVRFPYSPQVDELGAEFFRWEFATAVAGAALGVNPFDEPDVREAKTRTQAQLEAWRGSGAFTLRPPLEAHAAGVQRRTHGLTGERPAGAYVAILDYRPADPRRAQTIARLRRTIRARTGLATTYGVGPRYLHSTGQYHKGGPNTGIFAILTADDATTTPVPGRDYTFSALKRAQALGDFDALAAAGRQVVHWHLECADAPPEMLERLFTDWP
jgi:glucose-6-phosphate isomerase